MSRITTHFNLQLNQSQVDFVDVCLETDNPLFIDPKLIERIEDPYFNQMRNTLSVFSNYLFNYVRRNQRRNASKLFSGIAEPNETRLGYSTNDPRGNSLHGKLGEEFLDSIFQFNNTVIRRAGLNSFGSLEFFIPGVSVDRISDTVTKIIKADLIDFTQAQCNEHGIQMELVGQKDIYDAATNEWVRENFELPVFDGKPIIFVPKAIVRRDKDGKSNLDFFFRFAFRNHIKMDNEFTEGIPKNGRDNQVTYKDYKQNLKDNQISRKAVAERLVGKYPSLIMNFRSALLDENKLHTLTDEEILEIVNQKCHS